MYSFYWNDKSEARRRRQVFFLRWFCYLSWVCAESFPAPHKSSPLCVTAFYLCSFWPPAKTAQNLKQTRLRVSHKKRKNKLICVADFSPLPHFAQFWARRIWNLLSHSIWGGPNIPVKTITVGESARIWIYLGSDWAMERGEWHRLKKKKKKLLLIPPAGEVALEKKWNK